MGLFKKRSTDPDEVARLRSEIEAMGARLEASDAAKSEYWAKVDDIAERLESPASAPDATERDARLELVTGRVDELSEQLAAAIEAGEEAAEEGGVDPEQIDALRRRVDELAARLDTPLPTPAPPPPPTAEAQPEVDLAPIDERIDELLSRIDSVDARVTSISNELANQLSEISDELAARGDASPPADEVVDELRDTQVRLANEQARYQIAFRQDLADLAARLKRA